MGYADNQNLEYGLEGAGCAVSLLQSTDSEEILSKLLLRLSLRLIIAPWVKLLVTERG